MFVLFPKYLLAYVQVVNRLHKDHVYDTLLNYGVQYDNTWIYDKIHHEINQFCSAHSLQQVYIDMFDQVIHGIPNFQLIASTFISSSLFQTESPFNRVTVKFN